MLQPQSCGRREERGREKQHDYQTSDFPDLFPPLTLPSPLFPSPASLPFPSEVREALHHLLTYTSGGCECESCRRASVSACVCSCGGEDARFVVLSGRATREAHQAIPVIKLSQLSLLATCDEDTRRLARLAAWNPGSLAPLPLSLSLTPVPLPPLARLLPLSPAAAASSLDRQMNQQEVSRHSYPRKKL